MRRIQFFSLFKLSLFLIYLVFGLGVFGVFVNSLEGAGSSVDFSSVLTVGNAIPIVSSVVLNSGNDIVLTGNATTSILVSAALTDYNGCSEILGGTSTILVFRSGVGSSTCLSSQDNLNCYKVASFSVTSSCQSDITINATATVDIYYFAQATDASSSFEGENWVANFRITDSNGSSSAPVDSGGVELLTLTAIDRATSSINYGALDASSTTGGVNQELPLNNVGNSSATISVYGTALVSGSNFISTSSQHYATSTFYFGGGESSLSDVATTISGLILLPRVSLVNDLGGWAETEALPDEPERASYAHDSNYIYKVGGWDASKNPTSTVRYASFNSDGTIGSWVNTAQLSNARDSHASVVSNGYLYVIAGDGFLPNLEYGQISATGSIVSWSSDNGPPETELDSFPAVVDKGYLYVIGGKVLGDNIDRVSYTQLNFDGSVGDWALNTALPSVLGNSAAVVYEGRIYVIGGEDASGVTSTVIFSEVNSDGTLSSWTNTTALPVGRKDHGVVAEDGYIYVMGGATATSSVIYAPINANGTVGAWSDLESLPVSRDKMAALANKGYLYGLPNSGTTSTVLYSWINNAQSRQSTFWGLNVSIAAAPGTYAGVNTFMASYAP